jgi:hypothetical protein
MKERHRAISHPGYLRQRRSLMTFKPMPIKTYEKYIRLANWLLKKGKIDWNLYDQDENFICSIIIAHGKNTKSEITARSVQKTKKSFEERGLQWPPLKTKNSIKSSI